MMRKFVLSGAILALTLNPTGFAQGPIAQPAAKATPSEIARISIDTTQPQALKLVKSDFNADYAAAKQRAAEAEAAQLAAQAPAVAAILAANGLKPDYAAEYLKAQAKTGTPWQLIAAVHKVETGQSGTTTEASYAGAVGPMQFMPGTFAAYALDGNGDGVKNIYDVGDAILTGANYLRAGGAATGNYISALLKYNHSMSYANYVLGIAHQLGL